MLRDLVSGSNYLINDWIQLRMVWDDQPNGDHVLISDVKYFKIESVVITVDCLHNADIGHSASYCVCVNSKYQTESFFVVTNNHLQCSKFINYQRSRCFGSAKRRGIDVTLQVYPVELFVYEHKYPTFGISHIAAIPILVSKF